MKNRTMKIVIKLLVVLLCAQLAAFAQDRKPGKLKIKVSPKQAYTFVDDKAIGPGNRTIKLEPGTHHVIIANYGFKFAEQDVSIDSNAKVPLDIKLERVGEEVSGPRGRIQIEVADIPGGAGAAVLLNGKNPHYFVGHVDEFNHNIIWHQELIVPPGTHQVTVTRYGKEYWAGPITVAANQRVIVNTWDGQQKVKPWTRGSSDSRRASPAQRL